MEERPILFSGPMVRAILEGRKTQTRRVVKPQPDYPERISNPRYEDDGWYFTTKQAEGFYLGNGPYHCPYGQPGDLLVVAAEIPSLGRNYCADIKGNIWSRAKGPWRKLKGSPSSKGYLTITPAVDGKYKTRLVHRLVCEAWHGLGPKGLPQVRHLDGNQLNNDPRNLDWGTQQQNWTDRAIHGRGMGAEHHATHLVEENIAEIRKSTQSQRMLARLYNVSQSQIWAIKSGRTWREDRVPDPPNTERWTRPLTLRITNVRVERVQEITQRDAHFEGAEPIKIEAMGKDVIWPIGKIPPDEKLIGNDYRGGFHSLWDSINAKRGYPWESNPWVWVIEFERVKP